MPNLRAPLQPFITTRPRELVTIVLVELADGTGTIRIDVQQITRGGGQSRMRQCPDFEYF